jgi:ketosteroid isomerase-like protein
MLRPVRFLAPALVLLVLVGCGDAGPTPEEQVRTTVSDFGHATAAKDYKAMCALLAPDLIADVEQVGLPCERALKQGLDQVREPRLTIGAVKIDGDSATAEVRTSAAGEEPSKDTLKLANVNGTWKIASLGG